MAEAIIGRGWTFPPTIGRQGGLGLTNEQNEIGQSIRIILGTAVGERVMRPNFGCRVHELMFAPNNDHTAAQARQYVEDALGMWEPRIEVVQVDVAHDNGKNGRLLINIHYTELTTHDRRSLVYPFYLIPDSE